MKIKLTSVYVDDQDKALKFYTDKLRFIKKHDIPVGEHRWLTVISPDGPEDIELLLEPSGLEASRIYQKALVEQGIPFTAFAVENTQSEFERLQGLEVEFTMPPTDVGPTIIAVFNDTCGNLIQIYQG